MSPPAGWTHAPAVASGTSSSSTDEVGLSGALVLFPRYQGGGRCFMFSFRPITEGQCSMSFSRDITEEGGALCSPSVLSP